jgi:HlyD family secretion protein
MAQNYKRKWAILVLVAALFVLVLALLAGRGHGPLLPVVSVTRGDINEPIACNGKIEPINPTVALAKFATFVDNVMATEGQSVRRGQLILTLDAAEIRSELAQAQSNLFAAKTDLQDSRAGGPPDEVAQLDSDLEQAQVEVANLERKQQSLEQLVAKQAATKDELAQNQASLTKARANLQMLQEKKSHLERRAGADTERANLRVKEAQERVDSLSEKIQSATVIAPSDGTLYSLPVRKGDYVKVGDILAEMADLRNVRVRAFVDEPDLGLLEPDQVVQFTWDAKPGRTWTGRTEQIPKQVVPRGTRSVGEVLCSVNNDKLELLPNINLEVRIEARERQHVILVPRAAVRYDRGQHYVFVFAHDKVHRRDISVGIFSAEDYEVLSGLTDGSRVVLPGDRVLHDGMDVRAAEAE